MTNIQKRQEIKTTELDFTLDENIINHLISHQSGTLSKAILELVMNSIDAGANKIEIKINRNGFLISDNGIGFSNTEEIIKNFGRFGTPHEEGDATFGRFRIGRLQCMSFAKCSWRSNTFQMDVDIKKEFTKSLGIKNETEDEANQKTETQKIEEREKNKGYILTENLNQVSGCKIEGIFYKGVIDSDSYFQIDETIHEIKRMTCLKEKSIPWRLGLS